MEEVQVDMQTGGEKEIETDSSVGAAVQPPPELREGVTVQPQPELRAGVTVQQPPEPREGVPGEHADDDLDKFLCQNEQPKRYLDSRQQEEINLSRGGFISRTPVCVFGDNSDTSDGQRAPLKPRIEFVSSRLAFKSSNEVEKETEIGFENGNNARTQGAELFNLAYCDYEKATEGFQKKLGSGGEGEVYYGNYLIYMLFYPLRYQ